MNLLWYIRRDEDDVEKGPFERTALIEAVLQGRLGRETKVRREDQEEWSTLGEHSAFRAGLAGWRPDTPEHDDIPGVSDADPGLWVMAIAITVVHIVVDVSAALAKSRGGPEALGMVIGTVIGSLFVSLFLPYVAVLFSTLWEKANRSQSTRVKVFIFSSLALLALSFAAQRAIRGHASAREYHSKEQALSMRLRGLPEAAGSPSARAETLDGIDSAQLVSAVSL